MIDLLAVYQVLLFAGVDNRIEYMNIIQQDRFIIIRSLLMSWTQFSSQI